ncbi:MAG: RdgB/HAM1 family non-canonical purine NTP pyrophosphatase [Anaerolineae bacterium]|nr:RdgB/HAM1 family non-canonical purine NTP pyrophosphatase [Anaerolineae bacterium]
MDLLVASSNPGKVREYQTLLAEVPLRLVSLREVGLAEMQVEEDGDTLEANASLKAQAYARASSLPALADDTGLFVDALDGAPGIYPARYGGPSLTMAQRRQKLLHELGNTPDAQRTARFVCVIAVAHHDHLETVRGVCEGRIAQVEDGGREGFGYDAVFIPQGYAIPWSQVPVEEKNRISHRGQAARQIIPVLQRLVTSA